MKYIFVLIAVAVVAKAAESQGTYDIDHDNLDIQGLVANEGHFQETIGCFVDKGPCTAVAAAFKNQIPEAVAQACAKCTPAQRHIVKVFLDALKKNRPEEYQNFKNKYDPDGKYFTSFINAIDAF